MRAAAPHASVGRLALALLCWVGAFSAHAAAPLHALWELHGSHNTVYLLGSIHVLRRTDYPLAPAVLRAYARARSLVMEIDLADLDLARVQADMLASARLPEGQTLPQVLGPQRYARARAQAREVGVDLATFDQFLPWFAAEAISQQQFAALGFDPQAGVEMYFLERARGDGKPIAGLETVHDQITVFEGLSLADQADYLESSLAEAHDLPREVDDMVHAWQRGDTAWFEAELATEFARDPQLYEALLAARNRRWTPKIEALLHEDRNYLVIVGTGHLVGHDSLIELLKKDGVGATQR